MIKRLIKKWFKKWFKGKAFRDFLEEVVIDVLDLVNPIESGEDNE